MSLRILIGDDNPSCRSMIRRLLGSDARLVGEAKTAEEVVRLTTEQGPDVVLLDIELGNQDLMSLSRRIRAAWPWTTVILMTSHGEESYPTGRTWDGRERRRPARPWAPRPYIGPDRRGAHRQGA